jgi:hypothetical protein
MDPGGQFLQLDLRLIKLAPGIPKPRSRRAVRSRAGCLEGALELSPTPAKRRSTPTRSSCWR